MKIYNTIFKSCQEQNNIFYEKYGYYAKYVKMNACTIDFLEKEWKKLALTPFICGDNSDKIKTFMGLIICETPTLENYEIEVF